MQNDSYKKWHKPNTSDNAKTLQGYYIVRNKDKYIGDPLLVIYRSSWEFSFCRWCDFSPSILNWSSEPVKVPYYDRVSKLEECKKLGIDPNNPKNWIVKNYNTDFWVKVQKPDKTIEKWFIEIKPEYKLKKPRPVPKDAPLRDQKKFNRMAREYLLNEAKFAAMNDWSKKNKSKFYIFTEIQLRKFGIIGGRFDYPTKDKRNFN